MEKPIIKSIHVKGFKSLRDSKVDLSKLNVLIGANGAGKSNFASLFDFLSMSLTGKANDYVGAHGGADSILSGGAKKSNELAIAATMKTAAGTGTLYQKLGFKPPSELFYSTNHADQDLNRDRSDEQIIDGDCSIIKESGIGQPGLLIHDSLKNKSIRLHVLDTSLASAVRTECYVEDNKQLQSNGGNLAAMLYLYKKNFEVAYRRIRSTVQSLIPDFDDFVLEPKRTDENSILLNWKQEGNGYLLGPHQFSDGSLRSIALVTLLLQPKSDMPNLLVLDEPEIGLHPHATSVLAGLIRAASVDTQVIVCTQSPTLVDEFAPEEVVVVESVAGRTEFRRQSSDSLKSWLEDYSLGELWQKNVIGGGPLS